MNEVLVTKDQLDSHKNCLNKALDYLNTETDFFNLLRKSFP